METLSQYDLKSIHLPRLAGGKLRLFTWLLENPLSRVLLLRRLLRDSGITRLRQLSVPETPLFQPYTPYSPPPSSSRLGSLSVKPAVAIPYQNRSGFVSVLDYARAYRATVITPEEVAQKLLAALADSDARPLPLRAFIACDREDILRQAQASSLRWRDGKPLGLFDGVPVAVKDELDQIPYPTTLGTRFLNQMLTGQDATVVARLRAAGALLIGKTNMHEIGAGVTGLNPHQGTPHNPYQLHHDTGGSSSGSAAAVAAGLCPVAIGADGGGSIRIPAAFCGVIGLKPTYGRVSGFGGTALGCSVCQLGPIAATASDTALAYAMIAGPDPKDRKSLDQPPVTLQGFDDLNLNGLRLGVYWPWFEHASPTVVECCKALLKKLKESGGQVKEIHLTELDSGRIAHAVTILAEMASMLDSLYADHRRDFSLESRAHLVVARCLTARDYLQAQRIRARLTEHWHQVLREVDVIVTPTTGCSAPPIHPDALRYGESDLSLLTEIMRFVVPANLLGLPAISLPAGYDPLGLPVGFHAIARPWEEHVLLRLANTVEGVVERRKPPLYYQLLPPVS
jgi:Asp-tRNA(Asn)/Glu-tRNA(Gln) amidotransferase A subunit family amidase